MLPMLPLRKEIDDYSRACEHLIVAAASKDAIPFTLEEIDWIAYYAKEMTSLADQLVQAPRPQGKHDRQTMRAYARTSETLLRVKNLSNGERESIRDSVADVREQILDDRQAQP